MTIGVTLGVTLGLAGPGNAGPRLTFRDAGRYSSHMTTVCLTALRTNRRNNNRNPRANRAWTGEGAL